MYSVSVYCYPTPSQLDVVYESYLKRKTLYGTKIEDPRGLGKHDLCGGGTFPRGQQHCWNFWWEIHQHTTVRKLAVRGRRVAIFRAQNSDRLQPDK